MRTAILIGALALLAGAANGVAQAQELGRWTIKLPQNLASETVEVRYFLVGAFGGYGGYVKQERGVHAYVVNTSYENKPATSLKAILYAPGCQIQTIALELRGASAETEFICRELPSVVLTGRIIPPRSFQGKEREVAVTYMAHWAQMFFGVWDGPVASFPVGTAIPDANGVFRIRLPDFGKDPIAAAKIQEESFSFLLREAKTWNALAALAPVEARWSFHDLKIQSQYPNELVFHAREP